MTFGDIRLVGKMMDLLRDFPTISSDQNNFLNIMSKSTYILGTPTVNMIDDYLTRVLSSLHSSNYEHYTSSRNHLCKQSKYQYDSSDCNLSNQLGLKRDVLQCQVSYTKEPW